MELLVFLLITGIAVFIAVVIDKNIDKIDIPHIPPECLESDEDFLDDLYEDMDSDYPSNRLDDDSDSTLPDSIAWFMMDINSDGLVKTPVLVILYTVTY